MKKSTSYVVAFFLLISAFSGFAQDKTANKFGKGIRVVAGDSSFSLKFAVRGQILYAGTYSKSSSEYTDQFMVRRARLKFDGFMYSPKLTYKIELGLSNPDIANASMPQTSRTANVILDAVVKYNFFRNWSVWFGQTKLPGNIERVVSSGALQFVDRSQLNARYNIDRDAGVQLRYETTHLALISSLSLGEGRNITARNAGGYDYTQRVEWQPWGEFSGDGNYFESDLKREPTPRLMLGVTYDFNDRASRERGQLGDFLSEQRSLETWFVDAHLKYNGWSALVEFAEKRALGEPVIRDDNGDYLESFFVGKGLNVQAGYLFRNNVEVALRYTSVEPLRETLEPNSHEYTLGVSRYIAGHSLKVQSDVTLNRTVASSDELIYRFQIDFQL